MDIGNLNSFLQLGHFMNYQSSEMEQFDFSGLNRGKYIGADETELIQMMEELIFNSIQKRFRTDRKHLVPLSGGYDSRAVLAILKEFTPVKDISTYTFGIPRTYDFEIGNAIAKLYKTRHTKFNLNQYEYTKDELIRASKKINYQTVLFFQPPFHEIEIKYQHQYDIWSGWLGDFLSGAQCENESNLYHTKEEAISWYLNFDSMVRSTNLMKGDASSFYQYWSWNNALEGKMRWDDQISFYNRQLKYTLPQLLVGDLDFITPFNDPNVYNFFLNLPDQYRHKQYLYKKFLSQRMPELFSLPTKKDFGLPIQYNSTYKRMKVFWVQSKKLLSRTRLNVVSPMLNYRDFSHLLRVKGPFNRLVFGLLCDLEQRKILDWVDIQTLWCEHQTGYTDHTYALLILASLEIHLLSGLHL